MSLSRMGLMGLVAGASLTALSFGAQAQQPAGIGGDGTNIGVGMICNSQDQASEFLTLRAQGTDPRIAVDQVNRHARDGRACGVAAIAFVKDKTVETRAINDKLVQVVRINVIAGFNGSGWQPVAGQGMTQYAVLEGDGEAI